ncbi:MAG TPA: hypothetical protein VK943_10730 [Arenibaculum sp.]|nr:hypothetical protein [Arenibaculum sp.]
MKAFLFALVFVGLAMVAAGFILESGFGTSATDTYSAEGAQPRGGTAEERGWN